MCGALCNPPAATCISMALFKLQPVLLLLLRPPVLSYRMQGQENASRPIVCRMARKEGLVHAYTTCFCLSQHCTFKCKPF